MSDPPSGTVTFLYTDIEGSTQLWEQHPEAVEITLTRHDTLLRHAIEANSGQVFRTVGDGFCAVFITASDAVAAALDAQLALHAEAWGETGPLRVRMALHTGEAEVRNGDYFGACLNRIARLLAVAHGGQTLLSHATEQLVRDALSEGASLQDLGEVRLRDLTLPERVFQLQHPDLPADFPPLKSLDSRSNNLPLQPTPLIGREKELAAVQNACRPRRCAC
ncbi:MAG: adenylate/guanylate cyclase domain-containing protein [Candidatus Bipolaricaulia bacterium]